MLLAELQQKFYVLAKVTIDHKKIVICSNKIDCSFEYFEAKNNICFDVDKNVKEKLDLMLTRPSSKFKYIFVSNNIPPNSHLKYSSLVEECIQNIKEEIKCFDENTQSVILNNLNNVKVIEMRELPSKYQKSVPQNAMALYAPDINSIVLPNYYENTRIDKLRYYIQHELLHCASNYNKNPQITGLNDLFGLSSVITPVVVSQTMINEIYTEIVNNKIFDKHYNGRPKDLNITYDLCRLISKALFDELDYNSTKKLYFKNDPDAFNRRLMHKFHISNIETFYKLFLQMDVCNLIEANTPIHKFYNESNIYMYFECLQECCKSIMDIVINKYVCENKSLDKLTINTFLPDDNLYNKIPLYKRLRESKQLNDYLKSAKLCIKYLRKCSRMDYDIKINDYKSSMLKIFKYLFNNNPLPDNDDFEQIKSAELFLSIISDQSFVLDKASNKLVSLDVKKTFTFAMDPKNNFLPKNRAKAVKIVEKILLSKNSYNFDIVRCIPSEYVIEACNINNELFKSFIPKYLVLFINNITQLNDKNLLDEQFFNEIVKCAKSAEPNNALKFMFKYYKSISLKERTNLKFQKAFLNELYVEICDKNENETFKKIETILTNEHLDYCEKNNALW